MLGLDGGRSLPGLVDVAKREGKLLFGRDYKRSGLIGWTAGISGSLGFAT